MSYYVSIANSVCRNIIYVILKSMLGSILGKSRKNDILLQSATSSIATKFWKESDFRFVYSTLAQNNTTFEKVASVKFFSFSWPYAVPD